MEDVSFLDDAPVRAVVDPGVLCFGPGSPAVEVRGVTATVTGMGRAYLLCSYEEVIGIWVGEAVGAEALHDVVLATPGLGEGPHRVVTAAVDGTRELWVARRDVVGAVCGVGVL